MDRQPGRVYRAIGGAKRFGFDKMKDRLIELPTPDGQMDAFVAHPDEGGPFPPVILFMDVWGLREQLFDIARQVAVVGYYCMVPNFYYRRGTVRIGFHNEQGKMISLNRLDEKTQTDVLATQGHLTDAMVVADTGAILRFLDQDTAARPGLVGSVGYCMGGRHVLDVAGHYPERFQASASLHGTTLISDQSDSAHLLAPNIRGELYCGFAEVDRYAPPSMVQELADLFESCAVRYRYEIHKGTEHGYALPDRDIYDKLATLRDWELIFAMFHRQIPLS